VRALLEAGADPDEGRACGPPLLMGIGVWHDGDVLCPCCWLDRMPSGFADPDLPRRRVDILQALLDAGADPLRTHACAPGLTPCASVLAHLRKMADDGDDRAPPTAANDQHAAQAAAGNLPCEKHHLDAHRDVFNAALFEMAHALTRRVEARATLGCPRAAAARKRKRRDGPAGRPPVASRTRAASNRSPTPPPV